MSKQQRKPAQEQSFLDSVKKELDNSCDRLDGHTLSRLNSIRHEAMEKKGAKARNPYLAPFGGLATAFVLILAISLNQTTGPESAVFPVSESTSASLPIEDLEILTASEELDFFENFEFYEWLADNDISA